MSEAKFKPGMMAWSPAVGFAICEGDDENEIYPIIQGYYSYTGDGRGHADNKHPTLLTVEQARKLGYEPPKRTVKKTVEAWAVCYHDGSLNYIVTDTICLEGQDFIVKLTGEIEVEE